jgi:hypothetical protein
LHYKEIHNAELFVRYHTVIRPRRIRWGEHVSLIETGNAYKGLVDKPEERDILKGLLCGREDFIKVDLTQKVQQGVRAFFWPMAMSCGRLNPSGYYIHHRV